MAKGTDIFTANFADFLPDALKQDEKMRSLAAAVTEQLLQVSANIEDVLIYSRIDELPEALIDILAYDMHIDWYNYSYPLEIKRNILRSSVRVHKKMGTKYATEQALGAVWAQSEIEEWFQYGGEPHHFHIICDTSRESVMASYTEIVNAVKMYKRLSSHLDDVTYQSRIYITIQTHTDCFIYKTPLTGRLEAGTYPQRNRKGVTTADAIIVGTDAAGFIFEATPAGTVPERNRIFRGHTVQIDVETALNVFRYRNTPAGQIRAGEEPQRARRGAIAETAIVVEDAAEASAFRTPAAGTVPERNRIFREREGQIDIETGTEAFRHRNTPAGQIRAGEEPQRVHRGAVAETAVKVEDTTETFRYKNTPAGQIRAGEEPQRVRKGGNAETAVKVEDAAEASAFRAPAAGTAPGRNRASGEQIEQLEVEDTAEAFTFSVIAAGTVPERSTVQRTEGGTITNTVEAAGFRHTSKACGTKRKL